VVAITILNLCPFNSRPSVLVSGIVSLLITYMSWSSLMNETGENCNAYADAFKGESFMQTEGFIGVILIVVSLGYITFGESDE
jgi:Serine incorporator (Serinc)